jgi:hypothetical protein
LDVIFPAHDREIADAGVSSGGTVTNPMTKSVLIALIAHCLFISLSCFQSQRSREYHSTRFPETRSINEAKLWLHWSRDERLTFVRGFVIAYKDGAVKGCRIAFDAFDRYASSLDIQEPALRLFNLLFRKHSL